MKDTKYTVKHFEQNLNIIINKNSFRVLEDLKSHWLIESNESGTFIYRKF